VALLVRLQVGRRLGSNVDVDDLVQEIWLEVHRKITLFRSGSEREFFTLSSKWPAGRA
jgi:DNA-directed RNA polymerase specialized sigma24 family protein